jgi:hypothetical protein
LTSFYGSEVYNGKMVKVVNRIMRGLHARIVEVTSGVKDKFITSQRLGEKVQALSTDEWVTLSKNIDALHYCIKNYRDNFPVYRDYMSSRIFGIATVYIFFITLFVYLQFGVANYHRFKALKELSYQSMANRLAIAFCVVVIFMAILEVSSKKYAVKLAHNFNGINTNGDILVQNVARARKSMAALRDAAERNKVTDGDNKTNVAQLATTALHDVERAVDAYSRCNFVTATVPQMPFPVIEMILYSGIIVLFVVVALVAVKRMDPAGHVGNIKMLFDTRARLLNGQITNMDDVARVMACCQTPDIVWGMLTTFAILIVFMLTWWFVVSTRDTVDDYESAINVDPDCVS